MSFYYALRNFMQLCTLMQQRNANNFLNGISASLRIHDKTVLHDLTGIIFKSQEINILKNEYIRGKIKHPLRLCSLLAFLKTGFFGMKTNLCNNK